MLYVRCVLSWVGRKAGSTTHEKVLKMADFDKAFNRSSVLEGSYAATPDKDEIFRGISRRFHPGWEGWPVVDALKFAASDENELKRTLEQNEKLKRKIKDFHKQTYWDAFWGDEIPNQDVAAELFDAAREMGTLRSVLILQKSLNLLHGSQDRDQPLVEDGVLGPRTMKALERYLQAGDPFLLIKIMRIRQSVYYLARMRRNPQMDAFAGNWIKSLKISRDTGKNIPAPPTGLRVD
jgi:lysozyme family protein